MDLISAFMGMVLYYDFELVALLQKDLDGEAEVLLDPNKLSEDGTVALSMASVSKDGQFFAYGLSASGSDWVTIKVMRVDGKTTEPDTISWVRLFFPCTL